MESEDFYSITLGKLTLECVLEEIVNFVRQEPERHYKVVVGSDSAASRSATIVTAITVWRVGNGAIHFWTKVPEKAFFSMRERIMDEAMQSIVLGQEVRARLQDRLGDDFFWNGNEIHVDVGRDGATGELVDGIIGMIRGFQFEPVIKPFAYGASCVADRHT